MQVVTAKVETSLQQGRRKQARRPSPVERREIGRIHGSSVTAQILTIVEPR